MSKHTKVNKPTADKLLNSSVSDAKEILANLADDTRDKIVSDMWRLYHKTVAIKGV